MYVSRRSRRKNQEDSKYQESSQEVTSLVNHELSQQVREREKVRELQSKREREREVRELQSERVGDWKRMKTHSSVSVDGTSNRSNSKLTFSKCCASCKP